MTTIETQPKTSALKRGRHPINVGQLVMGIAFLGIVVVWILVEAEAVTGSDIRWLLPVPWVLAGGAGLIATTRRHRDTEEWREAAYAAHERGWIGQEPEPLQEPVQEPEPEPEPPLTVRRDTARYDDLDYKLARAEREVQVRQATAATEPADTADPADPADPDPEDPADPTDPTDPPDPT